MKKKKLLNFSIQFLAAKKKAKLTDTFNFTMLDDVVIF